MSLIGSHRPPMDVCSRPFEWSGMHPYQRVQAVLNSTLSRAPLSSTLRPIAFWRRRARHIPAAAHPARLHARPAANHQRCLLSCVAQEAVQGELVAPAAAVDGRSSVPRALHVSAGSVAHAPACCPGFASRNLALCFWRRRIHSFRIVFTRSANAP